jgi:hypothetical protein
MIKRYATEPDCDSSDNKARAAGGNSFRAIEEVEEGACSPGFLTAGQLQ